MAARILVVDDEPNLLRLVEYALKVEGHDVLTALSGQRALDLVASKHPDLVVLDVMLPDLSGIDICQRLRQKPESVGLPIIMLSAKGQVSDKIVGLEAGADEYVTKPIDMDELVARVASLLARTERLKARQGSHQARTIAFLGAKGGVGTTTVALNTAWTLASGDTTAVAVELHSLPGTFAMQLGQQPAVNLSQLVLEDARRLDRGMLTRSLIQLSSELRALFGPQKASEVVEVPPDHTEALLRVINSMTDYTILDLPQDASPYVMEALRKCDLLVLVAEAEPAAVAMAQLRLDMLKTWGLRATRVVAVSVRRTAYAWTREEVAAELSCQVVGEIPPATEFCAAALRRGAPFALLNDRHEASQAIAGLSETIGSLVTIG